MNPDSFARYSTHCPVLLGRLQDLQAYADGPIRNRPLQSDAIDQRASTHHVLVSNLVILRRGRPRICLILIIPTQRPRADTDGLDPTTHPQVTASHLGASIHRGLGSSSVAAQAAPTKHGHLYHQARVSQQPWRLVLNHVTLFRSRPRPHLAYRFILFRLSPSIGLRQSRAAAVQTLRRVHGLHLLRLLHLLRPLTRPIVQKVTTSRSSGTRLTRGNQL
jgi:hypothetical protein